MENINLVDNVDALNAKLKEVRAAQKEFATFTQEQVDKIFFEAAMAAALSLEEKEEFMDICRRLRKVLEEDLC